MRVECNCTGYKCDKRFECKRYLFQKSRRVKGQTFATTGWANKKGYCPFFINKKNIPIFDRFDRKE